MLHVGHRDVAPRHLRDLARVTARRVDDHFGADHPLLGRDVPLARRKLGQPGHPVLADDGRAHLLCADRQRVAQARRIGVPVLRRPRPRDHAVGRHERVDPPDLVGADDLHVEADDLRIAVDVAQPRQLALVGREPDSARLMPADILPGQPLEPGVELIAVGMHLGEVEAAGDARALPRRVPGRTRSKLVLLD